MSSSSSSSAAAVDAGSEPLVHARFTLSLSSSASDLRFEPTATTSAEEDEAVSFEDEAGAGTDGLVPTIS